MAEPTVPLVRSRRAEVIETVHRGAAAVVDVCGNLVASVGDPNSVYFVRSSGKPLQAVAAAETGAFDRFGYTEAQIALAAASHGGEQAHIVEIEATLSKLGLSEEHLVCPPSYPLYEKRRDELIRNGERPSRRYHNCSGKHCAMLAAALARGQPASEYWRTDHPHQRHIVQLFAEMSDLPQEEIIVGMDGCGVPTHALPLRNVALAYARLADPSSLGEARREACRRVAQAMIDYPYLVAGSERFDTAMLAVGRGRWVCKGGALGYFAAGVRLGSDKAPALGIALKIEDGNHLAACQAAVEIFDQLGLLDDDQREQLSRWRNVAVKNGLGEVVGYSRPEFELRREE